MIDRALGLGETRNQVREKRRRGKTSLRVEPLEDRTLLAAGLVAAYGFEDGAGTTALDVSGNGLDGIAINLPARAMTGHLWNGEVHRWSEKPEHYAAIHFHDDDLYDAGWEPDFELAIPKDMKSGIYSVKLTAGEPREDGGHEGFVTFFVLPPKGKSPSARWPSSVRGPRVWRPPSS